MKKGTNRKHMRRIIGLVVTAVTGLLILAACAPTTAPVAPAVIEEPVIESEPEIVEAESAAIDTSDLTLIGNTGRPQFLNSFASW